MRDLASFQWERQNSMAAMQMLFTHFGGLERQEQSFSLDQKMDT